MVPLNRKTFPRKTYPIRGVQFGEGNFLRAFVDYMLDISNEKGITNMGIAVVKPLPIGDLEGFHNQNNLYTVALRGCYEGEIVDSRRIISSISALIDPYVEFQEYLKLAEIQNLEFVFSNTTEAGIAFVDKDEYTDQPANSFPGKLTQFLYHRFCHFQGDPSKGLIIIPCELIENNGSLLKQIILQYASLWSLEEGFGQWIESSMIFANTLVDRIVTGYPKDEARELFEDLGYTDSLLSVAEPFALWVIESQDDISKKLPLDKAGLPVIFTKNQRPYRERKVRILNGGHTAMALAAFLAGENTVKGCMQDETIRLFLEQALYNEIIPTLDLPLAELKEFSKDVIERFENPFVSHALLDISLNSISKWKTRVLPSLSGYYKKNNKIPFALAFSLAALIMFYKSDRREEGHLVGKRSNEEYLITDSKEVLDFFEENSLKPLEELGGRVLKNKEFWGEDLTAIPGLLKFVNQQLASLDVEGAKRGMKRLLNEIV